MFFYNFLLMLLEKYQWPYLRSPVLALCFKVRFQFHVLNKTSAFLCSHLQ